MTNTTGLVIQGGDDDDELNVKIDWNQNGTATVYNVIYGGGGNDRLSGQASDFEPYATRFGLQLFGEDGNDTLLGSGGKDTLSGGDGNDTIHYLGGDAVVDGGSGRDVLDVDTYATLSAAKLSTTGIEEIDFTAETVTVGDLDLSHFVLRNKAANADVFQMVFTHQATVEDLDFIGRHWHLTGSSADDLFDVSSSRVPLWISAGKGDDTIQGGDQNDDLRGEAGNDIIFGGGGDDWMWEQKGTDTIHGGDGNDRITVIQQQSGIVTGDAGNDTIDLTANKSTLVDGGSGNDRFVLQGNAGDLLIQGGDGRDTIDIDRDADLSQCKIGGVETLMVTPYNNFKLTIAATALEHIQSVSGDLFSIHLSTAADFHWNPAGNAKQYIDLYGSDENDHIDMGASRINWSVNGGDGNDRLVGGIGIEALQGGNGDDALWGNGTQDKLNGGTGDDTIREYGGLATVHGGVDNDTLYAYGAKAYLFGDDGDDTLVATYGLDYMYGGDGNDSFVFSNATEGAIIYDFDRQGHDVIDFSRVTTIKNFQDMMSNHIKTIDGVHAVFITFGHSEIAINHVKTADLQASDFVF